VIAAKHPEEKTPLIDGHTKTTVIDHPTIRTGNPVATPSKDAVFGGLVDGVFAIGDCAVPLDQQLPATAQVAMQQAKYLAKRFKAAAADPSVSFGSDKSSQQHPAFQYQHTGVLAYIGGYKALAHVHTAAGQARGAGIGAWLFWRSAYFTKLMSVKNRILVPMYWFKSFIFGRDISRF